MKPIAKSGDLPFNVGGISVFAAVDNDKQAIAEQLYIFGERSTRVFDLINEDTSTIYTFMSMVSAGADRKALPLSATAAEIQQALGKNQFAVKVFDSEGEVLGYAYKFFSNQIVLSNGVTVPVTDFSAQTSVPVPPVVAVASVSLNKSSGAGAPGGSETLIATVLPADATDKSVTWSSSSASATVTSAGLVTLVSNGTAVITATTTDGAKTASCTYTVTTPVQSIAFNNATASVAIGASTEQNTTITPSTASNLARTFTTSDASIATVQPKDGSAHIAVITGVAAGTATITVTTDDGAKTATIQVTVA